MIKTVGNVGYMLGFQYAETNRSGFFHPLLAGSFESGNEQKPFEIP